MRITSHPVLGALPPADVIHFTWNGQPLAGRAGEPIAAALLAAGVRTLRHTRYEGAPRGIYCGIGHCFECRVTVNGESGVRACLTPLAPGMRIESEEGAPAPGGEAVGSAVG